MQTVAEFVNGIEEISSLPTTFIKVSELLEDPECRGSDLAKAIEMDQALTMKLMKLANSAFYGFRGKVGNVNRAISIIGFKMLKGIVLTISVKSVFNGFGKDSPVNMKSFWQHSIGCGITSRVLAGYKGEKNPETYFMAGFLHDIGRLVLLEYLPEEYRQIHDTAQNDERLLRDVEAEVLGFSHADAGGELIRTWDLPDFLVTAVTHHHDPSQCEDFLSLTSLVHISDVMTHAFEMGASGNPFVPPLNRGAWMLSGLDEGILKPAREKISAQYEDACAYLVE